jgi:hypothetical protein
MKEKISSFQEIKKCIECGYEFVSWIKTGKKYCSTDCYSKARAKQKYAPKCANCGIDTTTDGRYKRRSYKNAFCSTECRDEYRRNRVKVICAYCGIEFERIPCHAVDPRCEQSFCSSECSSKSRLKNRHDLTYSSWSSMIDRCQRPKATGFDNYGGRGISICERWLDYENFLADMGERPGGTTLDREDTDGDYKPGNCRWATQLEQARNRRTNLVVSMNGETKCLMEWSKQLGIRYSLLWSRITKKGMSLKEATR